VVLKIKDGPTLYHSGDTPVYFSDLELIGKRHKPDLALINIGGHFGMEPDMAAEAAEKIGAKVTVPHHYKFFPVLAQNPDAFVKVAKDEGVKTLVMNPGDVIEFEGKDLKR